MSSDAAESSSRSSPEPRPAQGLALGAEVGVSSGAAESSSRSSPEPGPAQGLALGEWSRPYTPPTPEPGPFEALKFIAAERGDMNKPDYNGFTPILQAFLE